MDDSTPLAYRPEQFLFDFRQVYDACRPDRWLPGYRGWVFAPQPWLEGGGYAIVDLGDGREVAAEDVILRRNPLWQRQQLGVAWYPPRDVIAAPDEACQFRLRFRSAVVGHEIDLIRAATDWCQCFLAARTSGKHGLAHHPVVAQMSAGLVRDVYALGAADLDACLVTPGGRRWLTDEVDSICGQLIKLAGGRAVLSGQMVYLRTLFLTLNRLYLE